jgi:hypothetical protein
MLKAYDADRENDDDQEKRDHDALRPDAVSERVIETVTR